MIPIGHYLFLSLALFTIGIVGVVTRRNVIIILMSVELILNAVNINLVAFSRLVGSVEGQIFAIFIITDAAAEAAVGLGIIIAFFRNRETVLARRNGYAEVVSGAAQGVRRAKSRMPTEYFLAHIWLIPLFPLAGAALMLFFGRRLPNSGVNVICVGSVFLSMCLRVRRDRAVDCAAGGAARGRGRAVRLGARRRDAHQRRATW